MKFEKWALGLFGSLIIAGAAGIANRLDVLQEEVTVIRVDIAAIKAREEPRMQASRN